MYKDEAEKRCGGPASTASGRLVEKSIAPVDNEMALLMDAAAHLEKAAGELCERIGPILRPEGAVTSDGIGRAGSTDAPEAPLSPVASGVRTVRHRLRSICRSLESRTARLEV